MEKIRVRFAPSPTGPAHIGSIRTAFFNYMFAKKHGGDFILRIEDTDKERHVSTAEAHLMESLNWCGIIPDEGVGFEGKYAPYKQSERHAKGIYKPYLDKLFLDGHAYIAFDTKEEIEAMKERLKKQGVKSPAYNVHTRTLLKNSLTLSKEETDKLISEGVTHVYRLKVPIGKMIKVHHEIRGDITVMSNSIDDKVIWKSDGGPTYHLANVIDDHLMEITHVIRGEEWLSSLPFHIHLYSCFEWTAPKFAHLPLILKPQKEAMEKIFNDSMAKYSKELEANPDDPYYRELAEKTKHYLDELSKVPKEEFNGKLSKRDGDRFGFPVLPIAFGDSKGFREEGFLPEAFMNMLALLGWNPGTGKEMMNMSEMIEAFTLEKINKSGARFDLKKAEWFNKQYMTICDDTRLAVLLTLKMIKAGATGEIADFPVSMHPVMYLAKVCGLLKQKVSNINNFMSSGEYFFKRPATPKTPDDAMTFFNIYDEKLNALEVFSPEKIHEVFNAACEESKCEPRVAGKMLRTYICGNSVGPPIHDIMALLGKEECFERLPVPVALYTIKSKSQQ